MWVEAPGPAAVPAPSEGQWVHAPPERGSGPSQGPAWTVQAVCPLGLPGGGASSVL